MNTELKPCPFCGEPAMIYSRPFDMREEGYMAEHEGETFIECTVCNCGIHESTKKKAIKMWNRRALNDK